MAAEHKTDEIRPSRPLKTTREDEVRLAALASAGDRAAQRRVLQMLLAKTRNIIGYMVNDGPWADDLTQTVMLKVLCSLKDYRGESSLDFWATRIAIRMTMKAIKTKRRRKHLRLFLPEPQSPFEETHASVLAGELRHEINRVISKLSDHQQVAIRLKYVHEYSIREIAEITRSSENTVRDRLRVGKKRLQSLFEKDPAVKGWFLRGKP